MSNYPQYPADAQEPPSGPEQRSARPASIQMAVNLIWAAVALTVLTTIVNLVNLDDAVDTALENDTTGTITESAARSGIIVFTVVVVAIGVGLYALLAIFIGKGKNWARIVYTVLAAIFLVLGVLGLLSEQPVISLLLSILQIALTVGTLFFLWKKESTAWLTGQPAA